MNNNIYYGKQSVNRNDVNRVVNTLNNNLLTQGPEVINFENILKKYFNAKYANVVSNGTAALHLATLSLKLKKNDYLVTSPISFVASANCGIYAGCKVDFVDIDSKTYNLDPNLLEKKLKKNKKIKAVVVVDYAGQPADWDAFLFLKKKYGFYLINDNCHALGASYKNRKDYALRYSDIVTQSFHPVKAITTGEGGAIITNNKNISDFILIHRNHGIKRSAMLAKKYGSWFYQLDSIGFNYRLSDINCSLGISQFNRVNTFIKKRKIIAEKYFELFRNFPNVTLPYINSKVTHAFHLFPLLIKFSKININKKNFFKNLSKNNIFLQVHYIPIHLQPYYKKNFGFKIGDFPNAEGFYKEEVSLPIYYDLNQNQQLKVINVIKKSIKK
jgi:UDP-4-amino-4,6-dideoxy-N-acetyl-beta-L-altrosamine transaminase